MSEKPLTIRNVDRDVWKQFEHLILDTQGTLYGHIGPILTEALVQYMKSYEQHHHVPISAKSKGNGRADVKEKIEFIRLHLRALIMTGQRSDRTSLRVLVQDVRYALSDRMPNIDVRTARHYANRLIENGFVRHNPQAPISLIIDSEWLGIEPAKLEAEAIKIEG